MSDALIIVSADSHCGAQLPTYRDYLAQRYWPDLDQLVEENRAWTGLPWGDDAPEIEIVDDRGAIRAGGRAGAYDMATRLRELDRDGVAGEIIRHGHQLASTLWFGSTNMQAYSAELRLAGARAFNRWAADFLGEGQGRMHGILELGPCLDVSEAVREIEWAAGNHFVAVEVPGIVVEPTIPPLYDRWFDPVWAACVANGLQLVLHAGHGSVQGANFARLKSDEEIGKDIFGDSEPQPSMVHNRRVAWQLMLGGVFDRYPELKIAFTEIRATWIPGLVSYLDARFEQAPGRLKRRPSEYFHDNFAVTPSAIRTSEVALRHAIGLESIMFGDDYPHPEGTWPNTADWIRVTFAYQGVPEDDARKILGENAIKFFGLDRALLAGVAAKVGPQPGDVLVPGVTVDPRKIAHFHKRSGFNKAMDDPMGASLRDMLENDIRDLKAEPATNRA